MTLSSETLVVSGLTGWTLDGGALTFPSSDETANGTPQKAPGALVILGWHEPRQVPMVDPDQPGGCDPGSSLSDGPPPWLDLSVDPDSRDRRVRRMLVGAITADRESKEDPC
jgi:hypothetical protein